MFAEAIAFVDFEMTGLDPEADRIIEACIERHEGGRMVDRVHSLVDPEGRLGASDIHQISEQELIGAPRLADLFPRLSQLLSGAVWVGHGTSLDLAFWNIACAQFGSEHARDKAIDTAILAQRAFDGGHYSLLALANKLGLPVDRHHRADADVALIVAAWPTLLQKLAPTSLDDLLQTEVGPHARARKDIVCAVQAAIDDHLERIVWYRPAGKPATSLRVMFTALASKVAIGYLVPGRGRREFRLSRIHKIDPPTPPDSMP